MEETTKRIIEIDIDLGASKDRLAEVTKELDDLRKGSSELRKQNAELLESVRTGEKAWSDVSKQISDNTKQLADNEAKTKALKAEQSTLTGQITETTKENRKYGDSYKELSAKLSDMKNAYRSLSKEQRDSSAGKEMLTQIQQLDAEMKNADASIGNFQRNVGDYENAIKRAMGTQSSWFAKLDELKQLTSGGLKSALSTTGKAVSNLGKQFLALLANPIVLTITAIAAAFKLVSDAIKNNEENMDRWKVITAPIGRITELLSNAFQKLAAYILNVVEAGAKLMNFFGGLLEKLPLVGDAVKEFNDEMRESIALEQEAQSIRNAHREEEVAQAKASLESQRLLTKAYDKANYTAKERLEFLRQATKIEQDRADAAEQLAKRELELARQRASISKNDSKTNDELAAKEAAYYQAMQQREALQTSLKRRESQLLSQIASEQKEAARAAEEAAKKADERRKKEQADKDAAEKKEIEEQKKYKALSLAEMQKAEDAINNIIEDAFKKREAIEDTAYQRRHDALLAAMVAEEEAHGTQTELYQAYMTQLEALETQHQQNLLAIKQDEADKEKAINAKKVADDEETAAAQKRIEQSRLQYATQIAGGLSDLMEAVAGDNEAMVKASKVVALAEVAIKQGVAIADAVAASAAGDPYTYALRVASAIASTVAAMATAIKSINSVKLARGTSYVQGPGTETSDSIPAMLSKGEGVVNARANRMFPGVVGAMNDASVGIWSPMMSMLRNSGGAPAQVVSPMQMSEVQMAEAFRNAVADLNIAVSVEEINRVGGQVKVVENLGSI